MQSLQQAAHQRALRNRGTLPPPLIQPAHKSAASYTVHKTLSPTITSTTALERFQKDFASEDRKTREQERIRKQHDIEKRRIEQLERDAMRWDAVEMSVREAERRRERDMEKQRLGQKRTANTNGLPYNPINLEYERNPEGEKLKFNDQDHQIRGYVRAHNMNRKGNNKYNPLNGQDRITIDKIVPGDLINRYETRLQEHYDAYKIKLPPYSSNINRKYVHAKTEDN